MTETTYTTIKFAMIFLVIVSINLHNMHVYIAKGLANSLYHILFKYCTVNPDNTCCFDVVLSINVHTANRISSLLRYCTSLKWALIPGSVRRQVGWEEHGQ